MKFGESLNFVSTDKSAFSVIRANFWEKALYRCFTKDRDIHYQQWLNKLENMEYPKRTRILFSELRSKNNVLETFNAIRNSENCLSESHESVFATGLNIAKNYIVATILNQLGSYQLRIRNWMAL